MITIHFLWLLSAIIGGAFFGFLFAACHMDRLTTAQKYELKTYRNSIKNINIPLPDLDNTINYSEKEQPPADIPANKAQLWQHIGKN